MATSPGSVGWLSLCALGVVGCFTDPPTVSTTDSTFMQRILQGNVDSTYQRFTELVARGRELPRSIDAR